MPDNLTEKRRGITMDITIQSNNMRIPKLGFGTSGLNGSVEEIVLSAIENGYQLIDTAEVYGSEQGVGAAIARAIKSGNIAREDLFVETKISPERHGYHEALSAFDESLNRLQIDYIDMYMIHWPVPRGDELCYREKNIATWQAFCELKKSGKVRHIGVCNFLERHLFYLSQAGYAMPEVNQLELHPGYQQIGLVNFCRGGV